MSPVEIFRPGTHTASSGVVLSFGAAEVDGIAGAYDPALHEAPVVVGHPEHDKPAYGWVKGLSVAGGALVAELDQVDPDFGELVKAGRFKKISASFYRPDAAANPKPGSWYLRHVGFLGAQPPSVKGLKPVQFAGAEDGVVEFMAPSWVMPQALRSMASALRGVREMIITDRSIEQADEILPGWRIDDLNALAGQLEADQPNTFVEREEPAVTDPKKPDDAAAAQREADLAKREAGLAKREADLKDQGAAFAERERKLQRADNESFCGGLVNAGKLAPGLKPKALALMDRLDGAEVVEFSEAEGSVAKKTELGYFRELLDALPKSIELAELARGQGSDVDLSDAGRPERVRAAVAFQEEQKKLGITVSIADALDHVRKGAKA